MRQNNRHGALVAMDPATILLTTFRKLRNLRKTIGEIFMFEVTASKFVKHFGQYKEQVQREPIAITSHGRTSGYFVSEQEYSEYLLLKSRSRKVFGVTELPSETMIAIAEAKMSEAHDHLNSLMD